MILLRSSGGSLIVGTSEWRRVLSLMGCTTGRTNGTRPVEGCVCPGGLRENRKRRRRQLHLTLTIRMGTMSIGGGSRIVLLRILDLITLCFDRPLLPLDQISQHLHLMLGLPQPLCELGDFDVGCLRSPHRMLELDLCLGEGTFGLFKPRLCSLQLRRHDGSPRGNSGLRGGHLELSGR